MKPLHGSLQSPSTKRTPDFWGADHRPKCYTFSLASRIRSPLSYRDLPQLGPRATTAVDGAHHRERLEHGRRRSQPPLDRRHASRRSGGSVDITRRVRTQRGVDCQPSTTKQSSPGRAKPNRLGLSKLRWRPSKAGAQGSGPSRHTQDGHAAAARAVYKDSSLTARQIENAAHEGTKLPYYTPRKKGEKRQQQRLFLLVVNALSREGRNGS